MKLVTRVVVSILLLAVCWLCGLAFSETFSEPDTINRLPVQIVAGAVGVLCVLAVCAFGQLVCPGCGRLTDPFFRRCRRCGALLNAGVRFFSLAFTLMLAAPLILLAMDYFRSGPSLPPPAPELYKAHYVRGFSIRAEAPSARERDESKALARKWSEEAVLTYHGPAPSAVKAGNRDGMLAGLANKEPPHPPYWVRANYPAIETEWRTLMEQMKAVGRDLTRIEDLRARTEALQYELEGLAKEKPTDDRALLNASGDKLSVLTAALQRRREEVAEEKRTNSPPE
jgi:hypothetical protein